MKQQRKQTNTMQVQEKETVVLYVRSTFNTENSLCVKVPVENYVVPSKNDPVRDGQDIYDFLKEKFEEIEMPKTESCRAEERGNEWTSHSIQYWD